MQLLTGGKDMRKQKVSFNFKLSETKNQGSQVHKTEGNKRQSSN